MHADMQYDPIERQGQIHELFKFGNPAIFKFPPPFTMVWDLATDHMGTISKFDRAGFLIFGLVFVT